jgi:transcriptional regulator with XRE-family HTH domain
MLQNVAIESKSLKQKSYILKQDFYDAVVGRIIELRKKLGLNQEEFAEKIGITRGKLSQIEIGRVDIHLDVLKSIVSKCSITYDELIDGHAPYKGHEPNLVINEPSIDYQAELTRLRIENNTLREALREIGRGIKE